MPKITKEDVIKLSKFARIELKDEEVDKIASSLESILEYMEILKEADISGVSDNAKLIDQGIVFREDETNSVFAPGEKPEPKKIKESAPGKLKGDLYEVPTSHEN